MNRQSYHPPKRDPRLVQLYNKMQARQSMVLSPKLQSLVEAKRGRAINY